MSAETEMKNCLRGVRRQRQFGQGPSPPHALPGKNQSRSRPVAGRLRAPAYRQGYEGQNHCQDDTAVCFHISNSLLNLVSGRRVCSARLQSKAKSEIAHQFI